MPTKWRVFQRAEFERCHAQPLTCQAVYLLVEAFGRETDLLVQISVAVRRKRNLENTTDLTVCYVTDLKLGPHAPTCSTL